jgi:hypothetical protein
LEPGSSNKHKVPELAFRRKFLNYLFMTRVAVYFLIKSRNSTQRHSSCKRSRLLPNKVAETI